MWKKISVLLLGVLTIGACTDDNIVLPDDAQDERLVEITISAGVDGSGSTRTSIANASGKNFWEVGDSVGIWVLDKNDMLVNGNKKPYKFKVVRVKSDQTKCELQGQVPAGYENNLFAAIYPYKESARLEQDYYGDYQIPWVNDKGDLVTYRDNSYKYRLSATIPTVQKAVKGSYDPEAYISIAVMESAGADLNFKNACTLIKFTAPSNTGKNITEVKLETRDVENYTDEIDYLTGKFYIYYAPTLDDIIAPPGYLKPEVVSDELKNKLLIANMLTNGDNQKYVTLKAPEGEYLEPGATYYMVVRNFLNMEFEQAPVLPSTGGGAVGEIINGYYLFSTLDYLKDYVERMHYSPLEESSGEKELQVDDYVGYPMLKTGHILTFTASDRTACTRKFKATSTVSDEKTYTYYGYSEEDLDPEGGVMWYNITVKSRTISSGFNFERNTYMPLTFTDNASNWTGKFQ